MADPLLELIRWQRRAVHEALGDAAAVLPQCAQGDLVFDQSGNIYGTTTAGGNQGNGVVYELTFSGGAWTETELYSPGDSRLFRSPYGGIVFDDAGNLYSTSSYGGYGGIGNVYRLSPTGSSSSRAFSIAFEAGLASSPR